MNNHGTESSPLLKKISWIATGISGLCVLLGAVLLAMDASPGEIPPLTAKDRARRVRRGPRSAPSRPPRSRYKLPKVPSAHSLRPSTSPTKPDLVRPDRPSLGHRKLTSLSRLKRASTVGRTPTGRLSKEELQKRREERRKRQIARLSKRIQTLEDRIDTYRQDGTRTESQISRMERSLDRMKKRLKRMEEQQGR